MRVLQAVAQAISSNLDAICLGQEITVGADASAVALTQYIGVALSTNSYAHSQTMTIDVALTLQAAASAISPPTGLTLASVSNISTIVFTVVGLDQNGNAQTETLTGVDDNTVTSAHQWSKITSITPSASSADDIIAGNPASTQNYPLVLAENDISPPSQITLYSASDLAATNFTIVGILSNGAPGGEVMAGPNDDTVTSVQSYDSITSITPSTYGAYEVEAGVPSAGSGNLLLNGAGVTAYTVPVGPGAYSPVGPSLSASGDFQGGTQTQQQVAAILNPPRTVAIYSTGDLAAINFTVTGFDRQGMAITETIAGPYDNTVNTSRLFAVVTGVSVNATVSTNVEVGYDGSSYSRWINLGNQKGHYQWKLVVLSTAALSDTQLFLQATSMPMNRVAILNANGSNTSAYGRDDIGAQWLGGDLPDDVEQIGGSDGSGIATATNGGNGAFTYSYVSDNTDPWAAVRIKVASGIDAQVVLRVIPTRTA